jgi:hypothetical protein
VLKEIRARLLREAIHAASVAALFKSTATS